VAFLGSEEQAIKVCNEASCLAEIGRKVNADYVAQARVGRFDDNLTIKVELYNSGKGNLMGSFTGTSKNIYGLLAIIDEKAADALFRKMPGVNGGVNGIGGVQIAESYEYENDRKRYLANITSEPSGASLSFNGLPDAKCTKTPCNVELYEGNVRIIANLEQYEIADTTVSISQKQNINIKLKPNFGVLEVRSAYLERIGYDKPWSLTLNDKFYSLGEIRLSPNKYAVKLRHECYENIDFEAGINKGSHEIFDMARHIALKKGGLDLSAEADGEPVSEPVFVNGRRVGETPFSGSVPVCAKVEVGENREAVNVRVEHKTAKVYKHQMSTEEMKRRARLAAERRIEQRRQMEMKLALEEEQRMQEQEEEERQNAWYWSPSLCIGIPVMLNSIDSNYSSRGFQISGSLEYFKPSVSFFRFGLNLDVGGTSYDVDALKKINPEVDSASSDFSLFAKAGAFVKLYPAEAFYFSGGVNYGGYMGGEGMSATGETIAKIPGTATVVFPVGAGFNGGGFLMEALYNIVKLKNSIGGYVSFNIGFKFGEKRFGT